MAAQIGPSGIDYSFQPFFGANKISMASAAGAGSTISVIGMGSVTASGTATTRTPGTSSLFSATRRIGYVLASAAINLATGWNFGANNFERGNVVGVGGFVFVARFGFNALTSGNRCFVGMGASAIGTGDPSASTSMVGVGFDAADALAFQFMTNDGAGTATRVATGITAATDLLYEVRVFCAPNDNKVAVSLERYNGDAGNTTALAETEFFTDLPAATTQMQPQVRAGSGTQTTGGAIDIVSAYLETDN